MGRFRSDREKINIEFVGRSDILNEFSKRQALVYTEERTIFNLYGEGGIGKTTLLNEMKKKFSNNENSILLFKFEFIESSSSFYDVLREQLAIAQLDVSYFLLAYLIYYQKKHRDTVIKEQIPQWIEESGVLTETVDLFTESMDTILPFLGAVGKGGFKALVKLANSYTLDKKILKKIQGLQNLSLVEIEQDLVGFLYCDLVRIQKKKNKRIIFIFDTFESIKTEELDEEIREFIKCLDGTQSMFVVAGREPLNWEDGNNEWKLYLDGNKIKVNTLSENSFKQVLSSHIKEKEIINAIWEASAGFPLWLEIAIPLYVNHGVRNIEDFKGKSFPQLFKRFLKYDKDKVINDLEVLAIPNHFNEKIYKLLTGNGHIKFQTQMRINYFSKNDYGFTLHQVLREIILDMLEDEQIGITKEVNKKIFDYYNYGIHSSENNIPDYYYKESLYHLIAQKTDKNLLKEWLIEIAYILENNERYYLLYPLYKQTIQMLGENSEETKTLFISLIKQNSLENDKRRENIGSGLFEKYYKYTIIEDNEEINQLVFDWLDQFGWSHLADFVMIGYLKSRFTLGRDIKNYVRGWISSHINKNKYTSLLLAEYLKKEDTKLSEIEDLLEMYLDIKEYSENFSFLFLPYLLKKEDSLKINNRIVLWLNQNKDEKKLFSYVIQAYLDSGKDIKLVESSIVYWINQNKDDKVLFSHVIQKFLHYGGEIKFVETIIQDWLDKNKDDKVLFSYVVQPYLDKGGSVKEIEEAVQYWLENNKEEKEIFSHIVRRYFSKNGSYKRIEPILVEWINMHKDEKISFCYVADSYLKNHGNISLVYSSIRSWLNQNKGSMVRNYLLQTTVKNALKVDMNIHCLDKYFSMLFRSNEKKKIREKRYKDIANCLRKNNFDHYDDKFTYLYIAGQYFKVLNKDIFLEKRLMYKFSEYILNISNAMITEETLLIITKYLDFELKSKNVVLKISCLYEFYLKKAYFSDSIDQNLYLDIANKFLSMEINLGSKDSFDEIKNTLLNFKKIDNKNFRNYVNVISLLDRHKIYFDSSIWLSILDQDHFYLQNYLQCTNIRFEIVKKYFSRLLKMENITNSKINSRFIPIITLYFLNIKNEFHDKIALSNFIKQYYYHKNMGKLIIYYLLCGNSISDISEGIMLFLKVEGHRVFLQRQIEKQIDHINYIKLNILRDIIQEV